MTCHGPLRWLDEALHSVRSQTFQDWELLVVDDGADYALADWYTNQQWTDSRVRILSNPRRGRAEALNWALTHSRGTWIANLDADDLFHPRKLEIQVDMAEQYSNETVLCSQSLIIRDDWQPGWNAVADVPYCDDISRAMIHRNLVNHSTVFAPRALLETMGRYDPTRSSQIDYELWLRMLDRNVVFKRIVCPLGAKRLHRHQLFESRNRLAYLCKSAQLQVTYARHFKAGWRTYALIAAKVGYGLLPMPMRRFLAVRGIATRS